MAGPIDRRKFLTGTVAAIGGLAAARSPIARALDFGLPGPMSTSNDDRMRVYVLVVDGLEAHEVSPPLMPRLHGLKTQGVWYESATAINIAETLPNHVAMMTGVHADLNGVPANNIWDPEANNGAGDRRQVDQPDDITAETLFETLKDHNDQLVTASVLSKEYLWSIFNDPDRFKQTFHWHPDPQIPNPSQHATDNFTMDATLGAIDDHDPDFCFISLGDVDRSGHADPTGAAADPGFRAVALTHTDVQIGNFVDHLVSTGRWDHSVVLVTADHGMDWSLPHRIVRLREAFDNHPDVSGKYQIGQNGGAALLYFTGDDEGQRADVVDQMREIAEATDGVARVADTDESDIRIGSKGGDLAVFIESGYRFTDPQPWSNPIPGNHGHLVTLPIPFIVVGGPQSPVLQNVTVPDNDEASNLDIAPTVAALFDATPPDDGYEGRILEEAFAADTFPTNGNGNGGNGNGNASGSGPSASATSGLATARTAGANHPH